MGPGKGPTGAPADVLFDRKMLVKVCAVMEPRRGLEEGSLGGVVLPLLLFEDMTAFRLELERYEKSLVV